MSPVLMKVLKALILQGVAPPKFADDRVLA
jgi:hypothetical protein